MNDTCILITGGYGTVGRRVAADLAPDYPGRLVVAGRSAAKAGQLAAGIGYGARARRIDVGDRASVEAALEGVGVVMNCIEKTMSRMLMRNSGRSPMSWPNPNLTTAR